MDINKFINLFTIVCGIVMLILGGITALGMTKAEPSQSGLLFILGVIILAIGLIQKKRKGY